MINSEWRFLLHLIDWVPLPKYNCIPFVKGLMWPMSYLILWGNLFCPQGDSTAGEGQGQQQGQGRHQKGMAEDDRGDTLRQQQETEAQ